MNKRRFFGRPPYKTVGERSAAVAAGVDDGFTCVAHEHGGGHSSRYVYKNREDDTYWEMWVFYSRDEGPSDDDRLDWKQVYPHTATVYRSEPAGNKP